MTGEGPTTPTGTVTLTVQPKGRTSTCTLVNGRCRLDTPTSSVTGELDLTFTYSGHSEYAGSVGYDRIQFDEASAVLTEDLSRPVVRGLNVIGDKLLSPHTQPIRR